MKALVITGGPASGKSFLLWHMRPHLKMLMLEPSLMQEPIWEPPQDEVDAVVIDHFTRVPNITEIVTRAVKWCAGNDCPLILAGQSGTALDQVMHLLQGERVVMHLERNFDSGHVRVVIGGHVDDLSVESLTGKALGLLGMEMSDLRPSQNC